jgi:CHAT domain-containing protein
LLYYNQARYPEAEPLYLRALAIREKISGAEHIDVARTLTNLANIYQRQARYAEAELLYLRAIAILEKALGPEHPDVADLLNNLAMLYNDQARYAEAEPLLLRSLAINEKAYGPEHPYVAKSLHNLASLYKDQVRYAEAEPLLLRSLIIFEKVVAAEHPDWSVVLSSLALLYKAQARYAEAEPLLLRSLTIREKALGPEHPYIATSLNNLALLYSDQSRYEQSYDYSVRSYGLLRTRFSASGYLESTGGRSELASNRKGFLSHVSLALHPEVSGDRVALNAEAFEALQLTRSSSAGRAAQQMALRFAAKDDAVAKIVRRQQDLQSQQAKLEAKLIEAMSEADQDAAGTVRLRERQSEVSKELKAVNEQIKEDFPRYAELMRREPLSVSEVQGLLGKEEALLTLTPSWNEKQAHIFLLSRSGLKVQTVDLSFDDMDTLVSNVRAGLELTSGRLPEFSFEASHELYQRLFSGLEYDLKRHKHILYVPAAGMESIPLGVLTTRAPTSKTTNANAAWLTKTHAVTRLPTIGSLKAARLFAGPSAGADPLKGFGDPVLNSDGNSLRGLKIVKLYKGQTANTDAVRALPALPETTVELKQIAQLLGANDNDLYLREAATETAVKTNDLSSSRVIAFATHGLVAGDLKHLAEPALVLTPPQKGTPKDDGLLTASEITQLKLDADWIILSACNTAAADTPGAGGLSGLARAFVYAGARSLLVSHWPVETNAAHRLTTGLFDALKANDNITKAEALRQSMLALANTKGFEHPALWAPFSVVGASSR